LPIGLFIFIIDTQNNVEIKLKYPGDLQISKNLLKIIGLSHDLEKTYNFSSIIVDNTKIASVYTGSEFLNLLLADDEDPADFENILLHYYKKIKTFILDGQIIEKIEEVYNQISLYTTFDEEQKLAFVYSDNIKRSIMDKLINDVFITKKELKDWINEEQNLKIQNLDPVLNTLMKFGLLKICYVDESSEEYIFCTGDVFITRKPPIEIILKVENNQIPKKIANKYMAKVKEFFRNYSPSLDDANTIIELMCDFYIYQNLKLLRISPATRKGLMKTGSNSQNLDSILENLRSKNVIDVILDENGKEFYFLLTDLCIEKFFPEYILKRILKAYNKKTVTNSVIIENLIQLKEVLESALERKKLEAEIIEEQEKEMV